MSQKALYLCCIAEPWINVAKTLQKENNIRPIYFVHWKNESELFKKNFQGECHLQTLEDAWKGLGFPEGIKPKALDEDGFKKISWYELNALKMMDRLDPLGNEFSFQARCYFFQDLVGFWLACIEEYGLDLVVSPSIPHRVFDYALYVACQLKRIKFYMFQMIPFGSSSVIIEDVDRMGMESQLGKSPEIVGLMPSPEIVNKIAKTKGDYSFAVPKYMVRHKENDRVSARRNLKKIIKPLLKELLSYVGYKEEPNTYWVKKGRMPEDSHYSWLGFQIMELRRDLKVRAMRKKYDSLVTKKIPTKFVLLALHYQPEETSCPTGGSYADQISILKLLDEVIPQDLSIVVKEHKSQFYNHQESASGRDGSFYHRLGQVSERVVFAGVDVTPFDLIDKAVATITISGTIGWESAIRGTPVLVFGRAWYENMPRVYKVKTKSDVVLAMEYAGKSKNKNLEEKILLFHYELEQEMVRAKHYKAYMSNNDVDMSDSESNIVNALRDKIYS